MRFENKEGLGNDFVVIDSSATARLEGVLEGEDGGLASEPVKALCGRDQRAYEFMVADVGNRHAVYFDAYDEQLADELGPAINGRSSGGSNVELCRTASRGQSLDVIVWERGVGRTQAFGAGACAAAVAAVHAGHASVEASLAVRLPGGALHVTASERADRYDVRLRGPARRVFSAQIDLPVRLASCAPGKFR